MKKLFSIVCLVVLSAPCFAEGSDSRWGFDIGGVFYHDRNTFGAKDYGLGGQVGLSYSKAFLEKISFQVANDTTVAVVKNAGETRRDVLNHFGIGAFYRPTPSFEIGFGPGFGARRLNKGADKTNIGFSTRAFMQYRFYQSKSFAMAALLKGNIFIFKESEGGTAGVAGPAIHFYWE